MMIKKLKQLLLLLLFLLTSYIAIAFLLMLFPTPLIKSTDQETASSISITRNLAHANIVLDLTRSTVDWQALFPELIPEQQGYLMVGWGDQAVYQSAPTWADLQPAVAFKALFINTPAVLHLNYVPTAAYLPDETVMLHINETTSQAIEQRILHTFAHPEPQLVALGYTENDRFYDAQGRYNLLVTCNTWVGNVLRQAGVSISRWTPFSYNVMYSIPDQIRTPLYEY